MWRAFTPGRTCMLVAVWLGVAACRRASPEVEAPARAAYTEARAVSPNVLPADQVVSPGRFLPDVASPYPGASELLLDGTRRFILAGMRIVDRSDGSLERARQVLPTGPAKVVPLPNRVGGGLIVYIVSGANTLVWHASAWMARLESVAEIRGAVEEMVPGFDRLYARMTNGDIKALDPVTGRQISLGPLPPATRIGRLAFADAWRAVAVVDFRGALATFDAGNTWRPIPLEGQNVTQLAIRDGDFMLETPRGRFALGPRGEVSQDAVTRESIPRRGPAGPAVESSQANTTERAFRSSPAWDSPALGRRPLRAVIEDGWPVIEREGEAAAVFAQDGVLYRVGLATGAVLETRRGAFRDESGSCHAVRLRQAFGFVCGASEGGTAIYSAERSLDVREVARFAHPRVVVASGNGGLVVRGSCAREAVASGANSAFCFFSPSGDEREVTPPVLSPEENGELRPVVLHDGRAVFVVAPADKSTGKVFVSRGATFDTVPIKLDDRKALLQRGYLLEGIEEREPDVLGAWALIGEELRGVRIGIDGVVELGRGSANVERTVVAGRLGFDWGSTGRGFETLDGGMTWTPVDLPSAEALQSPRAVTACGPVGCARGSWMRLGWGSVEEPDLLSAPAPKPSLVALAPARGISLRCEPTGETAGPVAPGVKTPSPVEMQRKSPSRASTSAPSSVRATPAARAPARPAHPADLRASTPTVPGAVKSAVGLVPPAGRAMTWSSLRGHAPPTLASSDVGLEAGTDPPLAMQARIYAWGARGADWSRTGHVQALFDDRFDLLGVHSTAVTPAPWSDENRASDALGLTQGQTMNWWALLDASGRAAVLVGQRGGARVDLYGAVAGEPIVAWRDADNTPLSLPSSVVRIGPVWFFLTSVVTPNAAATPGAWSTTVYRVDGGVARRLARLPRVPIPPDEFAPKLMRRAESGGLGLLVLGGPGFNQVIRDWYLLPIDPDTGELDEPTRLFGSDLEGEVPPRCAADSDGWVVATDVKPAPAARIITPAAASLGSIELRLRLDPGKVCVDAIAARAEGLTVPALGARRAP